MDKCIKEFGIKALEELRFRQPLTGKDGALAPLIKQLTEAALEGEIESHLAQELIANRRNGKSKKTIKTLICDNESETPTP